MCKIDKQTVEEKRDFVPKRNKHVRHEEEGEDEEYKGWKEEEQ